MKKITMKMPMIEKKMMPLMKMLTNVFSMMTAGAATLLIVATGCEANLDKEGTVAEATGQKTYTLAIEQPDNSGQQSYGNLDTKTTVTDAGKVSWAEGDKIRYYSTNGGTVRENTVAESGDKTDMTFTLDGSSYLVAVYGGTDLSDVKGVSLTVNGVLNAEQSGKFEDAHVSIAKLDQPKESNEMTFTNLTSLIKFSLTRTDVKKVVFSSANGETINGGGTMKITFSETTPTASFGTTGGTDITVNTNGSGTFYISTLPVTLTKGFYIQCLDKDGKTLGWVSGKKTLTLSSNSIVNLGTIDSKIEECDTPYPPLNIDMTGTANCYIVKPNTSSFQFNATVKGSSSETISVPDNAKAKVLWESYGTATAPTEGDIIKSASYSNGKITIQTGKAGNAVVAVTSSEGTILWSWHIWVTDYNPLIQYNKYANNAGTMMDRNLGALSATPGDVGAFGLLYQWGRKDPFLGGVDLNPLPIPAVAASTATWPSAVDSDSEKGSIAYATSNPTTFIIYNNINHDWYFTGDSSTDLARWNSNKGIYDPCPAGWRVPDGGSNGIWVKTLGSDGWFDDGPWDNTKKGMDFTQKFGTGNRCWYPGAGFYLYDGVYQAANLVGDYWSCTPFEDHGAYSFCIEYFTYATPTNNDYLAFGQSVRCQAE